MQIKNLNEKLYTDMPIDELDERLSMEELKDKLELKCWDYTVSVCNELMCNPQYVS